MIIPGVEQLLIIIEIYDYQNQGVKDLADDIYNDLENRSQSYLDNHLLVAATFSSAFSKLFHSLLIEINVIS
jgi:hypothetical protein